MITQIAQQTGGSVRAVDGGDRIPVFLAAPAKLPVAAAERPCAEADGGDVQV